MFYRIRGWLRPSVITQGPLSPSLATTSKRGREAQAGVQPEQLLGHKRTAGWVSASGHSPQEVKEMVFYAASQPEVKMPGGVMYFSNVM